MLENDVFASCQDSDLSISALLHSRYRLGILVIEPVFFNELVERFVLESLILGIEVECRKFFGTADGFYISVRYAIAFDDIGDFLSRDLDFDARRELCHGYHIGIDHKGEVMIFGLYILCIDPKPDVSFMRFLILLP